MARTVLVCPVWMVVTCDKSTLRCESSVLVDSLSWYNRTDYRLSKRQAETLLGSIQYAMPVLHVLKSLE
jgi:hypothetical protein